MYSMKEMFGVASVKGDIEKRTQLVVFENNTSDKEVTENVNAVISESKKISGVPDYATIITVHSTTDGKVSSVKLTLKTRNNDKIGCNNLCSSFVIPYIGNFKNSVISFISEWIDNYFIAKKAQINIDELNAIVSDACGAVQISFVLSNDAVVEIANDKIVLGISAEAAANIASLQIFNDNEVIRKIRREALAVELQSFTNACEILKSKTGFFKAIDIYTRNGVSSVLKKVYKKDVTKDVKEREVCKFEYKDKEGKYFGLIEKAKLDLVRDDEEPIMVKGDYAYFVILSPFGKSGKNISILSDSDTAAILDAVIV